MREISDLYLTALLRLRGHQPMKVFHDGRRTHWQFDQTPDLEADVTAFFDGSLQVSARSFGEAIRTTKGEAMHRAAAPVS